MIATAPADRRRPALGAEPARAAARATGLRHAGLADVSRRGARRMTRNAPPRRPSIRGGVRPRSAAQGGGVVGDVLADETGDEVIAVVVAGLQAQGERMPGGLGRGAQQLGTQLGLQEVVGVALVH